VLQDYLNDPVANRRAVLALRVERHTLPPMFVVALGDAALRAGRRRLAEEYFADVVYRDAGQPWTGWAEMQLGWIAVLDGDLGGAHLHFETVAETAPQYAAGARLALGIVAGAEGSGRSRELFAEAAAGTADAEMAQAARLGAAYARYWSGDFAGAATAFDRVAAEHPDGRFADDAAYGAARSRWQSGDVEGARIRLEELAGGPVEPAGARRAVPGLVDLDAGWLVRAGVRRYRRSGVRPPDKQAIDLLDGDGRQLARAALAAFGSEPEAETGDTPSEAPVVAVLTEHVASDRPAATSDDLLRAGAAAAPSSRDDPRAGSAALRWLVVAAIVSFAFVLRRAIKKTQRVTRRHGAR